MTAHLTVRYFAQLRESAGLSEEHIPWREGESGASLYNTLRERHHFALGLQDLRLAINDRFAPMETRLQAGDQIVFIPPVAGG